MSRRARPAASLVALAALAVVGSVGAQTEATAAADRTAREWVAAGADVTRLPARFLFEDGRVLVALPPQSDDGTCTHVAVIGARGSAFRAQFADASNDPLAPEAEGRSSSVAGVVELRRCDGARIPRHVAIASEAGRGAVEIVVAHAPPGLPALTAVLPERTGGVLPRVPQAGLLPPQISPEKRAEMADVRARREGASTVLRGLLPVAEDGTGEEEIDLATGCHRIELFAVDPRQRRPGSTFRLDVDAELRSAVDDRMLARDRTESPNAALETCLGEPERVSVVYVGAIPKTNLVATIASWPLPRRLPSSWGSTVTARMARAVFDRHLAALRDDPVYLGQGTSGKTPFPVPIEPGGCYVAVAAVTRGQAQALQLKVGMGVRRATNERGAEDGATAVSFCAHEERRARIEVLARGPGLGFGLAVYRVASGVWEDMR